MSVRLLICSFLLLGWLGCTNIFTSESPSFEDEAWKDSLLVSKGVVYHMNDSIIEQIDPNTFETKVLVKHDFGSPVKFRVNHSHTKAVCQKANGLIEYSLISGKQIREIDIEIGPEPDGYPLSYFFGYLNNDTTLWYLRNYQSNDFSIEQIGPKVELVSTYVEPNERNILRVNGVDFSENNDLVFAYSYTDANFGVVKYRCKILYSDSIKNQNVNWEMKIRECQYLEWSNNANALFSFAITNRIQNLNYFINDQDGLMEYSMNSDLEKMLTRRAVMGPSGNEFLLTTVGADGKSYLFIHNLVKIKNTSGQAVQLNGIKAIKSGINHYEDTFDWE